VRGFGHRSIHYKAVQPKRSGYRNREGFRK